MHHHHQHQHHTQSPPPVWKFALSATLHCLLGCGLGEVAGMIVSTALHMGNVSSIVLAVILGAIGGFALGVVPWLRAGLTFAQAMYKVLIVEGLSIAVMETAEVLTEIYTPGVMNAHINDPVFWLGMLLALAAGFVAAYPVNYVLAKRGVRHKH